MTDTSTSSADSAPLKYPFGGLAAALFVIGLLMAWTGYQGNELLVVGTELNIVNGMAGLMLTWFFGVVLLFAALYMEPGFDH